MGKKNVFNLSFKKYLLFEMLSFIVSLLSLSLLSPLIFYYRYKKEAEATIINGKQLKFIGKIYEAYIRYILWVTITAIIIVSYQYISTLIIENLHQPLPSPIYYLVTSTVITFLSGVFIKSSFRRWKYKSTIIDNEKSFYKGSMLWVIISSTLRKILNIISIGLFYPLIKEISYQYEIRGVVISSRKLLSRNISKELYKTWFKNLLWLILSLGIYLPYLSYKMTLILVSTLELSKINCPQ